MWIAEFCGSFRPSFFICLHVSKVINTTWPVKSIQIYGRGVFCSRIHAQAFIVTQWILEHVWKNLTIIHPKLLFPAKNLNLSPASWQQKDYGITVATNKWQQQMRHHGSNVCMKQVQVASGEAVAAAISTHVTPTSLFTKSDKKNTHTRYFYYVTQRYLLSCTSYQISKESVRSCAWILRPKA